MTKVVNIYNIGSCLMLEYFPEFTLNKVKRLEYMFYFVCSFNNFSVVNPGLLFPLTLHTLNIIPIEKSIRKEQKLSRVF